MTQRGLPDWGVSPGQVAAAGTDPGLTSEFVGLGISRLDGKGRVVIADTFRNGSDSWFTNASTQIWPTTGGAIGGNIAYPLVPPVSLLFERTNLTTITATRRQMIGVTTRLGLETAFFCSGVSSPTMDAELSYDTIAGRNVIVNLRFVASTGAIQVFNTAGGTYATIATVGTSDGWVALKLVANAVTGLLERLLVGQKIYDLTQSCDNGFGTTPGKLQAQLKATGVALSTQRGYVGYFLVTTDEP